LHVLIQKPAQNNIWIPQELTFCNRSFFTEVWNFKYFWIFFHGSPEEASHYTYKIKIVGENGNRELIFKGKVTSLDVMRPKFSVKTNKDVWSLCNFQVDGQLEITLCSDDYDKSEI
jgi:hypothetical protein